jgi:hypothetical protein
MRKLSEILVPNKFQLDVEWEHHAEEVYHFLEEMAAARQQMDAKKERLDEIRAELDFAIRRDPNKFGLDKVTETLITNTITLQPQYREASQQFLESKDKYNTAANIVTAMEHKKKALEGLVNLHIAGYYALPTDRKEAVVREKATQTLKRKIAKKM